jgi:16S rRNA (guanine527-N7)-methyltransferase
MMVPTIPRNAQEPLAQFLELLDHWNGTHALTSLEKEERFEELLLDSAALLPHLESLAPGGKVVDFGTGMGIPALVLAVCRPDLRVVALDKSRKKVAFVRQAALELGLGNLEPVAARAEDLPPLEARAGVAKAVGTLDLLLSWWDRHGAPGAPFLALKGPEAPSEALPGRTLTVHPYRLPTRGSRSVVVIG